MERLFAARQVQLDAQLAQWLLAHQPRDEAHQTVGGHRDPVHAPLGKGAFSRAKAQLRESLFLLLRRTQRQAPS